MQPTCQNGLAPISHRQVGPLSLGCTRRKQIQRRVGALAMHPRGRRRSDVFRHSPKQSSALQSKPVVPFEPLRGFTGTGRNRLGRRRRLRVLQLNGVSAPPFPINPESSTSKNSGDTRISPCACPPRARLTCKGAGSYVARAENGALPSSSGLGRGPLKAQTRVRFPLGAPLFISPPQALYKPAAGAL